MTVSYNWQQYTPNCLTFARNDFAKRQTDTRAKLKLQGPFLEVDWDLVL